MECPVVCFTDLAQYAPQLHFYSTFKDLVAVLRAKNNVIAQAVLSVGGRQYFHRLARIDRIYKVRVSSAYQLRIKLMKRTVSIPVKLPSDRFLPLMDDCAKIFNKHIDWAIANHSYNKNQAHKELYHLLRIEHSGVPSALLQTIRDNALEAIKATKFKGIPRKKPTSGLRYDKRTMTLRGKQLTLSCIGKRVSIILNVPDYFQEVFETWKFCGATLTYIKNTKQFWVRLVFETETPRSMMGKIQGIDRGLYNQAVTNDGQFFSSSRIRATQRRYLYNRRRLQQKGTRSAFRRLKAMSGREKRFMKDTNHCVSKKLANQADVAIFVIEDLSNIRTSSRGRKVNKWLSSWPFYQQELFLTYKAEALGKRVVHVDPRYTSQKCNVCKHVKKTNRHKSRFHCKNCGYRTHADLNAANNIRDSYILSSTRQGTQEQASVNMPYVSADSFG